MTTPMMRTPHGILQADGKFGAGAVCQQDVGLHELAQHLALLRAGDLGQGDIAGLDGGPGILAIIHDNDCAGRYSRA
jgi:hypothetical protein